MFAMSKVWSYEEEDTSIKVRECFTIRRIQRKLTLRVIQGSSNWKKYHFFVQDFVGSKRKLSHKNKSKLIIIHAVLVYQN